MISLFNLRKTGVAIFSVIALFGCSLNSCKKIISTNDGGNITNDAVSINDYVASLSYNADDLLNVQSTDGLSTKRSVTKTISDPRTRTGGYYNTCSKTTYSLLNNADDIAILRPTNGIIYPGALVKGDESLLDGAPTPITTPRAPVKLRIDLPGISDNGNLTVENPNNSTIQSAIDDGLQWWNNNAYQEGYVNPAYISYKASTSYSQKQLAIDVDLNVEWAGNAVSGQFSKTSSTTKKVAMMVFKQGFYTVTMNTPRSPAEVFGSAVTLEAVKAAMNSEEPPAYVHSVVYGRIIMFRMESKSTATDTEMETALKYTTGVVNLTGSAKVRIESILSNTNTEVITIGGNASVASNAVTARSFADLAPILKGDNAVYSKNNPGVPIGYTIRFLKDNTIAKMGYSTEYTVPECKQEAVPSAILTFQNDGGYEARATLRFKNVSGNARSLTTSIPTFGVKKLTLPAGSNDITIDYDYKSFLTWYDLKTYNMTIPVQTCYKSWGTTFSPQIRTITCQ
jgi:thiol-activated cytolysin